MNQQYINFLAASFGADLAQKIVGWDISEADTHIVPERLRTFIAKCLVEDDREGVCLAIGYSAYYVYISSQHPQLVAMRDAAEQTQVLLTKMLDETIIKEDES